jgi:hypothetical protein
MDGPDTIDGSAAAPDSLHLRRPGDAVVTATQGRTSPSMYFQRRKCRTEIRPNNIQRYIT